MEFFLESCAFPLYRFHFAALPEITAIADEMKPFGYDTRRERALNIRKTAARIAAVQRDSGEIPWAEGHLTDPWDHVEAAMGLSVGGHIPEAERAYRWLAAIQNSDGSWFSAYRDGAPVDRTRDANFSSYIAVGVFHHFLITGDRGFLQELWPSVRRAVDFALSLQAPQGEIYWAVSPRGRIDKMALVTGSSSICMSLRCALAIAAELDRRSDHWRSGLQRLEHAIAHKPHRFNMTKSRYSMDWFYPVLCGIFTGPAASRRIERHWKRYVVEGQGVRCVFDAPWITVAETSELTLALAATGNRTLAEIVFNWIGDKRYEDGSYWAGFTFPDMTIWPEERLTWTDAVVLMAADALYDLTPAGGLFSHQYWRSRNR
jgi:hypothetical protein